MITFIRISLLFGLVSTAAFASDSGTELGVKCANCFPGLGDDFLLRKQGDPMCVPVPCCCLFPLTTSSMAGFRCTFCCITQSDCMGGEDKAYCGANICCLGSECAKTEKAVSCVPRVCFFAPMVACGKKLFRIGCCFLGAKCSIGTDEQTCGCCGVDCGNIESDD